ncbi:DUF4253 domain-containing protein [Piscinibacter sp. HJYY11]|uniref:DUF4253 domain-containing protein n=1 Tax=Piscinibacter sp. HJYY11 TaxID=2801333 RepID=UPI00191E403B|nr:DUF4253 domain-containing protein [Piscinibacter sp. HJYY11]MBL0731215.1 DUF4253 domain-containing protein [Piscinibacter sp. HJYY11]
MIHRRTLLLSIGLLPGYRVGAQPSSLLAQGSQILQDATGQPVREFSTQDFGREVYSDGRSVLVAEKQAERLLNLVRTKLPVGLVAFVGVTSSHATPKPNGVELVVAAGKDQFDILRVAATDGVNHGLSTEDVIKELVKWNDEFGIDIWQAETDVVQLRLKTLPKNLRAFANRVYKFCPDIVDQGTGDVRKLEKLLAQEKAVLLWWD